MLHIHFGTGRLGLGLVAPFFKTPTSELFLLNRKVSHGSATGSTALSPERRNQLLSEHPDKQYIVQTPDGTESSRVILHYDDFCAYDEQNLEEIISSILDKSKQKHEGIVVTGSVLLLANYRSVIQALNILCDARERDPQAVGKIFLVACENTVSAAEIFDEDTLTDLIKPQTRCHVGCVHALVDRLCVGLEEDTYGAHPTVRAVAEEYGSLKLQLTDENESMVEMLRDSRIEFSRHVDTEKQIKSWLLNGGHWLIALRAFAAVNGDHELKLNHYLKSSPENMRFAAAVLDEMAEGVAILLRNNPQYADFVREVDVDDYLKGAKKMILYRFSATDDPITRILARFRAPTPEEHTTIEAFNKRFAGRVDEPIMAYEAEKGVIPPASSQSIFSLHRLMATGTFIHG
ncbi:MAG TPA: hypothetical protein VGB55_06120 [Tepidisphaeraceae bacterium]|jgi:mannitol-1-phosphate/altronate dehydrogenase